jgi:hypothetical protein
VLCLFVGTPGARAQAPETKPAGKPADRVMGEVTAVDAKAGTLAVKTPTGQSTVKAGESTQVLKAKPGATSLEGAQPATLVEVAVGDRILARGTLSEDGATLTARQVIVMTRGDIASKQEQERSDWRRRGIAGVVTALDPEKKEITVEVRSAGTPQTVVVTTSEKKAALRRYSGDSVKFSDAKPSTFADLSVGDQLRALGDRSEDGARLSAEQVVSGAFRTVVGAVDGVDAGAGEIQITDGATNTKLTVAVKTDALLRRLPPEMAARMGARRGGAAPGAAGGAGAPPARGEGGAAAGEGRPGGGGPAGPGRGAAPNLGDLLERMPALSLTELKPGDRVAISATTGADATRVTAIALVAGIEPLLAAPESGSRRQGVDLMPGLPAGALDMGMGGP